MVLSELPLSKTLIFSHFLTTVFVDFLLHKYRNWKPPNVYLFNEPNKVKSLSRSSNKYNYVLSHTSNIAILEKTQTQLPLIGDNEK